MEKIAEILFEKNYSEHKNECLETAKQLKEFAEKRFVKHVMSEERVEENIKNNKSFRHNIFGNLGKPTKYTGEKIVEYRNVKIWAVKNIARIYADVYVDKYLLKTIYVEVRKNKENLFNI